MKQKKLKIFISSIIILIMIFIIFIYKKEIAIIANDILNSFYVTLIEENRYKLLLNGLFSTGIISIASILLGTIIGVVIYCVQKCKLSFLNKIFNFYIKLMQGIPITVLLLTFYYVIFGNVNINPMIVAIITFSLYFSAYISEIIKGAMASINISQIYSAYSLGFNKYKTFRYIVFPQALVYIIPVYKNEIVSLIKLTSIAGYISIMDLTKASDIIRNRTYEAFFPLIITALIYFILCYVIGKILDLLYKKINPRNYERVEKNAKI